jgi:hypothetical protein
MSRDGFLERWSRRKLAEGKPEPERRRSSRPRRRHPSMSRTRRSNSTRRNWRSCRRWSLYRQDGPGAVPAQGRAAGAEERGDAQDVDARPGGSRPCRFRRGLRLGLEHAGRRAGQRRHHLAGQHHAHDGRPQAEGRARAEATVAGAPDEAEAAESAVPEARRGRDREPRRRRSRHDAPATPEEPRPRTAPAPPRRRRAGLKRLLQAGPCHPGRTAGAIGTGAPRRSEAGLLQSTRCHPGRTAGANRDLRPAEIPARAR